MAFPITRTLDDLDSLIPGGEWHLGMNVRRQWNVYADGGEDVTPGLMDETCGVIPREVCEYIVLLHNERMAKKGGC